MGSGTGAGGGCSREGRLGLFRESFTIRSLAQNRAFCLVSSHSAFGNDSVISKN